MIRGLTLDRQMTKHLDQKMNWSKLRKMTTGIGLMNKLSQASKKRFNSVEMPENKLDAYFHRVD